MAKPRKPYPHRKPWSDQDIETLKDFAQRGRTAREAGDALAVSKNAAIAKGRRNGVTFAPAPALRSDLCRQAAHKAWVTKRADRRVAP